MGKFVRAWEPTDLNPLVALLTDDVFVSVPPMPFEYDGREDVARSCASIFRSGRRFDLVRTRAKRSAGVRSLPARSQRHQPCGGSLCPHPHGRPYMRHDQPRKQCAPTVRATAITPDPIASFRAVDVRGSETHGGGCAERGRVSHRDTAPIPGSSGEESGEPVRHRLNRGGNRRINAVLHRLPVNLQM